MDGRSCQIFKISAEEMRQPDAPRVGRGHGPEVRPARIATPPKICVYSHNRALSGNLTLDLILHCTLARSNQKRNSMRVFFTKLIGDETGVTAVEYGLIAALIAVAAVTIMTTVGTNLSSTFSRVATKL